MTASPSARKVPCGHCARDAEPAKGADIYPHLPDLADRNFWHCVPCGAWVGCHPGGDVPLGTLADAGLRRARMRAHEALDALWKGNTAVMTRKQAYAWLAGELGMRSTECHIAMFGHEDCAKVVRACLRRAEDAMSPPGIASCRRPG